MNEYARTLRGMDSYCVRAYGDALEVIPSTLAENAGLNPISTVTELRNRHAQGEKTAGINVRKVTKSCTSIAYFQKYLGVRRGVRSVRATRWRGRVCDSLQHSPEVSVGVGYSLFS